MKALFLFAALAAMTGTLQGQTFYIPIPKPIPGYGMYTAAAYPSGAEPLPANALQKLFSESSRDLAGVVPPPLPKTEISTPLYIDHYKAAFTMAGNDMEPQLSYLPPGVSFNPADEEESSDLRNLKMLGSVALGSFLLFGYYAATRRRDVET